ncbi:MAG: hypothetical protein ACRCTD_17135 [Beijerinckiaceae bacterium]
MAHIRTLLTLVLLITCTSPAYADAIDGEWCAPEGTKSLRIQGSTIRTPGGKEIKGNYGRHDFSYVAPDGDPTPGVTIDMRLMGEQAVRVTERGGSSTVWRRCAPGIS